MPTSSRPGFATPIPRSPDRLAFAHSFAGNDALRLFYGYPYDAVTVGGYSAWRVGGTLAIVAAVFGVLAAVRALRTEEDTGRMELVLAGRVGRGTAYLAALAAIAAGAVILWAAEAAGFIARRPARGRIGLPGTGDGFCRGGVHRGRRPRQPAGAYPAGRARARQRGRGRCLLLRAIADTSAGAGWLRWLTPLGWAEQLRPFAGAQPWVLVLPRPLPRCC